LALQLVEKNCDKIPWQVLK